MPILQKCKTDSEISTHKKFPAIAGGAAGKSRMYSYYSTGSLVNCLSHPDYAELEAR